MYNGKPPSVPGSDTSEAAALSASSRAPSQKQRILHFLASCRHIGATSDDVERAVGLVHQAASARLRELEGSGNIAKLEEQRETGNGEQAHVYVIIHELHGRPTIPYEEYRLVKRSTFESVFADLDPSLRQTRWQQL